MSLINFSNINSFLDNTVIEDNSKTMIFTEKTKLNIFSKTLQIKKMINSFNKQIQIKKIKKNKVKEFIETIINQLVEIEKYNKKFLKETEIDDSFIEENKDNITMIKFQLKKIKMYLLENEELNNTEEEERMSLVFSRTDSITNNDRSYISKKSNSNILNKSDYEYPSYRNIEEKYIYINNICDEINNIVVDQNKLLVNIEKKIEEPYNKVVKGNNLLKNKNEINFKNTIVIILFLLLLIGFYVIYYFKIF